MYLFTPESPTAGKEISQLENVDLIYIPDASDAEGRLTPKKIPDVYGPRQAFVLLPPPPLTPELKEIARLLQELGIMAVVFDFDKTITTIHSHGRYPTELIDQLPVTEGFGELISLLQWLGIPWGIASFADSRHTRGGYLGGSDLILAVLEKNTYNGRPLLDYTVIDPLPIDAHLPGAGQEQNKSTHLLTLTPAFNKYWAQRGGKPLRRDQIMLIDDQADNIKNAITEGYRVIYIETSGLTLTAVLKGLLHQAEMSAEPL